MYLVDRVLCRFLHRPRRTLLHLAGHLIGDSDGGSLVFFARGHEPRTRRDASPLVASVRSRLLLDAVRSTVDHNRIYGPEPPTSPG
jgi:hypothetical protein